MRLILIPTKGKHKGMPIPITVDLFMIGSGDMCQMRTKVPGIGEQQCILLTRDKKVFVRDLGSGESTVVNGEVVPTGEEWPLHAGDRLELASLEFMIQFNEKGLAQRDLEEWALKCLDQDSERAHSALDQLEEARQAVEQPHVNAASAAAAYFESLSAKRGLVKGRLRLSLEGDVTIVRINDAYLVEESELAFIKKELYDNLTRPNLRVLLDMKNVRRMSSMAAEMLADLERHIRRGGGTIAMCRLQPELRRTITDIPALRGIPVFADKAIALAEQW